MGKTNEISSYQMQNDKEIDESKHFGKKSSEEIIKSLIYNSINEELIKNLREAIDEDNKLSEKHLEKFLSNNESSGYDISYSEDVASIRSDYDSQEILVEGIEILHIEQSEKSEKYGSQILKLPSLRLNESIEEVFIEYESDEASHSSDIETLDLSEEFKWKKCAERLPDQSEPIEVERIDGKYHFCKKHPSSELYFDKGEYECPQCISIICEMFLEDGIISLNSSSTENPVESDEIENLDNHLFTPENQRTPPRQIPRYTRMVYGEDIFSDSEESVISVDSESDSEVSL